MPDDLFQMLTESDRRLLLDGARRVSYRRGDFLFHEGQPQPDLYIVRKGLVRVERQYQGHGLAVARYGPGDVLGEVSFLSGQRAHGSVVAEEDVEADLFAGQHINGLLTSDAGFASRFFHSLAVCLGQRLLQILPGLKLPEALAGAGARPRLPRTGQLTERQFPPELAAGVDAFRSAMRTLAADLHDGRLDADAGRRVSESCDAVADLLDRYTQDDVLVEIGMDDLLAFRDVADLARGVGGYVFRETFPYFMQSATIAQGFERPHGHAEDRDFLDRIERNEEEGDGQVGRLIDRWFLDRPLCRSRRNSVRRMTALLREAIAGTPGPGPARLTSLSAGTSQEIFDLLSATSQPVYVTCLDADADALSVNGQRARELHQDNRITFLQTDLASVLGGAGSVALGPQQVIYGLGVCDYLSDDQVTALLDWAHGLLSPGGCVVLTNRDASSPDRAFVEHILDWPVRHRTEVELGQLFARSRFQGRPPQFVREEAGVNLFARCGK
jgi:extracellular factor (EF) 3-hydroxypalmitic acid methyl ester biosynthesis protein